MTLRFPVLSRRPALAGAGLAAGVFLAALGLVTASPESMVARGFAVALEDQSTEPSTSNKAAGKLVAGTEAYWLDQKHKQDGTTVDVEPAAWPGAEALGFNVGDRITISSAKGARVLEVVAITEAPVSQTRIETGAAGKHEMIVTCRDTLSSDGHLLSFLTAGTGRLLPTTATAKPPQTL